MRDFGLDIFPWQAEQSELADCPRFHRVHNQEISHHLLDAVFSLSPQTIFTVVYHFLNVSDYD